ncbi:MAG: selenocysteine-specific translation elongation factor [Deltaproteobacteria bacterium RBG_13_61_14]|nr:MAG: selenocysteine-specific translation elongation factor [Deltaproteobacteria bacterium RBG_13_61_14]
MAETPHLVIGTAGHVDHGKTTLVKALTGVDLDTLPEEKARGLTINLGFTHFDTSSGLRIGVVDVPGHHRFIKTMLAGAHGLDFVLFLVACDDSVMPQTREHLAILRLLGLERGIIVLTKKDLADAETLELVQAEVDELTQGTFLEKAPRIAVSAQTGEGLPELIAAIDRMAGECSARKAEGPFRLFLDRVFTVAGAGTVVTGTVLSGKVAAGDELELLPAGAPVTVRQIEVHGSPAKAAEAGQRTALNLRSKDKTEPERGELLATPGTVRPTYMVDARLEVLADLPGPIAHWTRVRFYLGTSEAFGRLVLLDCDEIHPGHSAYVQLRLESPVPAVNNDRFIARRFSADRTIGGGAILDAHPVKHKRHRELMIGDLKVREQGYLAEVVELEAKKAGYFLEQARLSADLGVTPGQAALAADELLAQGKLLGFPLKHETHLIHAEAFERFSRRLAEILAEHHQALPQLARGLSAQELRQRLSARLQIPLPAELFEAAKEKLVAQGRLKLVEATIALAEHRVELSGADEQALARIRRAYDEHPLDPPATEEVIAGSGLPKEVAQDYLGRLAAAGALVRVSREFFFPAAGLAKARADLVKYLEEHGSITVSAFRELIGTSRKFALPLLAHFDEQGLTVRDGDLRRLRKKS